MWKELGQVLNMKIIHLSVKNKCITMVYLEFESGVQKNSREQG
jgi:hypothetical protein